MATPLLPYDEWVAGTLQNSVPANTNALRSEVLAANVISDSTTAQPGSPADGDCYIIPAGATGTQWATFAEGSLAYYRAGTWYEFTAYEGLLKVVAGEIKIYNGSAWEVYAGGGGGGSSNPPLSVEEGGVEVSADVATINFTGSGVIVTETSPGVVEVDIGGGGGGGGGTDSLINFRTWFAFITAASASPFVQAFGLFVPSFTGSSTTGTISTTSPFTSVQRRNIFVSSTANAVVGQRGNDGLIYYLGNASRVGGFKMSMTYGIEVGATTSTHRFFMGLRNSTSDPSDAEPSSYTNIIGIGYDAADTQVQLMHNDGSGTATKVALGASFPKPTVNATNMYTLTLETVAGSGVVSYTVYDRSNGATASGSVSTNLPLGTQGLNHWSQLSAGGATAAMTLAFVQFAVEV